MRCRTNIMLPNTGKITLSSLAIGSMIGLLVAFFSMAGAMDPIPNAKAQSGSGQTLPLIQNFDNDDCGVSEGWQVVSVDSDVANTWSCSAEFSNADVNGFGDDVAANEWLITPALNMDAQTNDTLNFRNWTRFTDANYPQLVVRYSTNYDGSGNLSTAAWNAIGGITFSPVDSQDWLDSGSIDLSGISGSNVYFAFHYTSTGTAAGSAANWRIDDIVFGTAAMPTSLPTPNVPQLYKIYR